MSEVPALGSGRDRQSSLCLMSLSRVRDHSYGGCKEVVGISLGVCECVYVSVAL